MSLHLELASIIESTLADALDAPIEHKQDVMILRLANGITLDVRYAAADAYSMRWLYGDAELGIDTAPLHPDLPTFPNHLHDADGVARPDPITQAGASPADNLQKLVRALLENPLLGVGEPA